MLTQIIDPQNQLKCKDHFSNMHLGCVCIYVLCGSAHMQAPMVCGCTGQRIILSVSPCFSSCLRQAFLLFISVYARIAGPRLCESVILPISPQELYNCQSVLWHFSSCGFSESEIRSLGSLDWQNQRATGAIERLSNIGKYLESMSAVPW